MATHQITHYINNFKFSGSGICTYLEYIDNSSRSSTPLDRKLPENNGFSSGTMTKSAKKRVKNYLDLWFNSIFAVTGVYKNPRRSYARFLTFVTLTLPSEQSHDDQFLRRYLLTPFLAELQRLYNVGEYLWKAELQNNGNIHWHVLIDQYIHWAQLRQAWNRHLDKLGYISKYTEKRLQEAPIEIDFLTKLPQHGTINQLHPRINALSSALMSRPQTPDSFQTCIKRFSRYLREIKGNYNVSDVLNRIKADYASGFINPNSTDIHAPEKIKNLCSYITKYICKKEIKHISRPAACAPQTKSIVCEVVGAHPAAATLFGRVWGCSDGLRTLKNFVTTECDKTKGFLTFIKSRNLVRHFDGEFFSFDAFNLYELLNKYCKSLFISIKAHFSQMYYLLYPPLTLLNPLEL